MATETRSHAAGRAAGVPVGTDLGLLLLRVILGGLFMGHGLGKLFGWFGQGGIDGTAAFFKSVGYEPAKQLVVMDGILELAAGAMLLAGFLIPLAAAIIIGDMMNAAVVKSPHGFWVANQGFEYEFVIMILLLTLTVTGAGVYALDRNREWFGSRVGGVAVAVVLGVIGGVAMLIVRK
jgi:putative oxidoreductase